MTVSDAKHDEAPFEVEIDIGGTVPIMTTMTIEDIRAEPVPPGFRRWSPLPIARRSGGPPCSR